jgi:hypothetical protein
MALCASLCCMWCENASGFDFFLQSLEARMGSVSFVVCLDSGTGDYERVWLTTSLRGLVVSKLTVQVLEEGSHSGKASGIVPDSFRVARMVWFSFCDTHMYMHLYMHIRMPLTQAIPPLLVSVCFGLATHGSISCSIGLKMLTLAW